LQLERWSDGDEAKNGKKAKQPAQDRETKQTPYQYSLQLLVPPGQLELGRRLITAMYSSSPDLSDLEVPQLLQLVALAECYGIGKGVTAVAAQLQKLTVQTMPLETAAAVFELPDACLALDAFQQVLETAADVLQQQLGDLEVVWSDQQKEQLLQGMPFNALLRLLKHSRTRVASEDTAVYTAARWLEEHPGAAGRASELVAELRLAHCTPTFLMSSSSDNDGGEENCVGELLHVGGVTQQEMMQLCAMSGTNTTCRDGWLRRECQHRPSWQKPPRPASSVTQLRITWQLPLSELQGKLKGRKKEAGNVHLHHEKVMWCGRPWVLGLCATPEGDAWLHVKCLRPAAFCQVQLTVKYLNRVSREELRDVYIGGPPRSRIVGREMFCWGPGKTCVQVGEWLREQQLVHPGDKLHLGCVVTSVA